MYPEGMLDRDQRTAKISLHRHRCSDNLVPNRTKSITSIFTTSSTNFNSIINIVSRRRTSKISYLIWKKGYLIPKFQRLKNVLLVIVYLMLTILPTTHSAPSTMNPPEQVYKLWLNNCLTQINYAKSNAENFKIYFTEYDHWVDVPTPWLPAIKKKVDNRLTEDELSSLTVKEALPLIYKNLQSMKAVLQKVTIELSNDRTLKPHFVLLRDNSNPVLGVLKEVMESMGIPVPSDVSPDDALPPEIYQAFRANETTNTVTYLTIIFRECINNYQHAQESLSYLLNHTDVNH